MPDSEEKSAVISVRVAPSFHERVKEAAQEQGYGTMTAAFRHALATTLLDDGASSDSDDQNPTPPLTPKTSRFRPRHRLFARRDPIRDTHVGSTPDAGTAG